MPGDFAMGEIIKRYMYKGHKVGEIVNLHDGAYQITEKIANDELGCLIGGTGIVGYRLYRITNYCLTEKQIARLVTEDGLIAQPSAWVLVRPELPIEPVLRDK